MVVAFGKKRKQMNQFSDATRLKDVSGCFVGPVPVCLVPTDSGSKWMLSEWP